MARGRVISPDFWSDGNMVGVSAFARLFYIGTWNVAYCDQGHLEDDPMGLKLRILPADPVDPVGLLDELMERGRIVRLRAGNGKTFLHIPTFGRWQKADPRWKTRCPACALINSGELIETLPCSPVLSETLPSSALRGEESKGEETNREERRGVIAEREDTTFLCTLLADLIEGNGSKRPTVTEAWLTAARLMLDKDGRELERAERLLRWTQDNEFWRSNILSMPKFREKYDQLRLQAEKERQSSAPKLSNAQRGLSVVEHFALLEQGELTA